MPIESRPKMYTKLFQGMMGLGVKGVLGVLGWWGWGLEGGECEV